jgi:hypothetical protein
MLLESSLEDDFVYRPSPSKRLNYFLGLFSWMGKTLGPTHSTPVMVEGYRKTIVPGRTDVYMYTEWRIFMVTPSFVNSSPTSLV